MVERTAQPARLGRGFWAFTVISGGARRSLRSSFGTSFRSSVTCPPRSSRRGRSMSSFASCRRRAARSTFSSSAIWSILRSPSAPRPPTRPMRSAYKSTITASSSFGGRLVPALFVVLLSIVSVRIWYEILLEPENGLVVEAIGHQFYFSFRYPQINGEVTDEMHLPLERAGDAQPYLGRRDPRILGAGDAAQERHGSGIGNDDPVHAAAGGPLSDHLYAVLRRRAQ